MPGYNKKKKDNKEMSTAAKAALMAAGMVPAGLAGKAMANNVKTAIGVRRLIKD